MAAYLKSRAGSADSPAPLQAEDPVMVAGQAIYRDQCSACHRPRRQGRAAAVSVARAIPRWRAVARRNDADPHRAARRAQRRHQTGADRARHAVVRASAQ